MIRKLPSGRWQVDLQPGGRGNKRIRRSFKVKTEAQRFERWVLGQYQSCELWNSLQKDRRTLVDLLKVWYDAHGRFLNDGERRYRHLQRVAEAWGDPIASQITASHYTAYRSDRIEEGRSPKTCNNELGYLNAVFNELRRVGEIQFENPFANVRPIRIQEREMGYLNHEEILTIFREIQQGATNPHAIWVARISLETGARWSEAENLTKDRVKPYRVVFQGTKSGKKRSVPISKGLYRGVSEHLKEWGTFGTSTISVFRRAVDRAGLALPKGQCAHILRHTFASHFMMNGGNILTLQKILGHSTINMTMRYAHLAPDHLEDAVKFNPMKGVDTWLTLEEG